MSTCPKNFRRGVVPILGILIICFFSGAAVPAVAKQPLFEAYKRIIVLDPGHGGHEIGARGADGLAEKSVTLVLAQLVAVELMQDYHVKLTRTDDYQVDLNNRTALANHLKADVFVSLHTGGSFVYSTVGPIIYYYQSASTPFPNRRQNQTLQDKGKNIAIPWQFVQNKYIEKSQILARIISSRLSNINSLLNIRVQEAPLAVLEGADMPAILIELGYLTNPAEEKNLRDQTFLADIAADISKGIKDFLSRSDKKDNQ